MIKYTEIYVQTLARGLCNPGEQFLTAAACRRQPWWSLKIPWFRHAYLLLATSERLVVVDHRKGLIFDRIDRVDSYAWSQVGSLKLSGLLAKKLVAKDAQNRTLFSMTLPPWIGNPIANNAYALRNIVHTWEQRRALPQAQHQAFGQLPQQAYVQGPYGQA